MSDTGRVQSMTEAERMEAIYSTDWLTPEAAGKAAGDIGPGVIYAAIEAGELRARNLSKPEAKRKRWKIRRDWLDAWAEARTVNDAA